MILIRNAVVAGSDEGIGSGVFLMDRVVCTGDEEKLTDCVHNEAGMDWNGGVDSSCNQDLNSVRVVCVGKNLNLSFGVFCVFLK